MIRSRNIFQVWRRWVAETIADSKASGGYAVIVDKVKHSSLPG